MLKRKIISGLMALTLMMMVGIGPAMADDSITGTVTEKGEIIVLDTADGSYVLEGSDMPADMVGKKVKVTGTIAEKDNFRVINVVQIEEATE